MSQSDQPTTPWRVKCSRSLEDETEYRTVQVAASSSESAREAALTHHDITDTAFEPYDTEQLCVPCHAAMHEPCEAYTSLLVTDPERVPLGERYADHLVGVPMCVEHFETMQSFLRGDEL
ncbi:hypothetical protein [Natronosalvus amylolyticus]|uniref:hypothetical protein n=1 Tax=Natronosalvus amylolyticus TaxID=2961994 RepID=UPI0020C94F0C|nr:hypothetical protein [Natronosalvus amylolyticus]